MTSFAVIICTYHLPTYWLYFSQECDRFQDSIVLPAETSANQCHVTIRHSVASKAADQHVLPMLVLPGRPLRHNHNAGV